MSSQAPEAALRRLAFSIGDFIRYWGFRRIHGAIWTLAYLSPEAVSGTELARRLKVSKALVSSALTELETWGLLERAPSPNDKTILYRAVKDVDAVIKRVLRERELPLLRRIQAEFSRLESRVKGDAGQVNSSSLTEVGGMLGTAEALLSLLLASGEITGLPGRLPGARH